VNVVECKRVAELIFDHVSGRLTGAERAEVDAHLEHCAECKKLLEEERVAAELLRTRLPRHGASEALKQRLVASAATVDAEPRRANRFMALAAAAIVFAAGVVAVVFFGFHLEKPSLGTNALASEALNDHLRVLYADRPVEVESGGIHQVKPWFTGRLDFAPVVAFDGDDEYALKGGSVGYFIDRKAAVFVYKLRLHTISVLVFRAEGLPWAEGTLPVGAHRATVEALRGFHVVLLRDGDIGYAAVSDVATPDIVRLLGKVDGVR
jgi:anti-sigma factor RsiW